MSTETNKNKGRPPAGSTYYSLLNHYNRDKSKAQRVECECGKIVIKTNYQNHLTTKVHEHLMKLKHLAEQGENLLDPRPELKKESVPNETIDELLLKMTTDVEYRKKVKHYLEILEKNLSS